LTILRALLGLSCEQVTTVPLLTYEGKAAPEPIRVAGVFLLTPIYHVSFRSLLMYAPHLVRVDPARTELSQHHRLHPPLRERLLRERVTYMLWVIANQVEREEDADSSPHYPQGHGCPVSASS
jgi:hypothetical protein